MTSFIGYPPFPEIFLASRIVWSERQGIVEVDWHSPVVGLSSAECVREFVPHPVLDDGRLLAIVAGRVK